MKKTIKSNVENCLINQVENYLIELESGKDANLEHYWLTKILHFTEAFAITEPLTEFGDFAEVLSALYPSHEYMVGLLNQYQKNLTKPAEKVYLARIQDCALRHQIIDRNKKVFQSRWAVVRKEVGCNLFLI